MGRWKYHHSNVTFISKHDYITLANLCGAKQGSFFACPSSNCVASFKSRAFFPPPTFAHKTLVYEYAFQFRSADIRCNVYHLILNIEFYCDDDTRYTAAVILPDLILHIKWSLDRTGDFPLITKLKLKYKNCSVDILSHPPEHAKQSFSSTALSYDHEDLHTCPITTNTLTTTHIHDDATDLCTSSARPTSKTSSREREFYDHTVITAKSFFGIQYTLKGDITRWLIWYLVSAYTRLKYTKRHKYSIVSIQTLLRSFVIFVYGFNPLCNQIPCDKFLAFDQVLHSKYIRDTRHTVT